MPPWHAAAVSASRVYMRLHVSLTPGPPRYSRLSFREDLTDVHTVHPALVWVRRHDAAPRESLVSPLLRTHRRRYGDRRGRRARARQRRLLRPGQRPRPAAALLQYPVARRAVSRIADSDRSGSAPRAAAAIIGITLLRAKEQYRPASR